MGGKIYSHCSYCGQSFYGLESWPRQCTACGRTSYLNPIPVVVVLLPIEESLLLIRRNIEPCKNTLNFPGGYLDVGETWREGACRELLEETGIALAQEQLRLYDVQNGLDNTIVIFGLAETQPREVFKPFSSPETQELVLVDRSIELGFPLHTEVLGRYFADRASPDRQGPAVSRSASER